jgi:hypothetical protein
MITIDPKEFFVRLNAAQCKIADLNGRSMAVSQEWVKFVKNETEI